MSRAERDLPALYLFCEQGSYPEAFQQTVSSFPTGQHRLIPPSISQDGLDGDATCVLHEMSGKVMAVRNPFTSDSPLGTQAALLPTSRLLPLSYILGSGPSSELPQPPAFPLSQPQPHPVFRGGLFGSLTSPGADRVQGLGLVRPSEPPPQWAFTNTL